jgi:hypothetical protein
VAGDAALFMKAKLSDAAVHELFRVRERFRNREPGQYV